MLPCGRCYPCRNDRPNVCVRFRLVGVHLDGGLAERLEVPAGLVFGVGDLDPDSACFVEPASVAVHALARGRIQRVSRSSCSAPGRSAWPRWSPRSKGARVLSVDPQASRRDLAKRLGAEEVHAGQPEAELEDHVRDWTNSEGPPLIVETSGEAGVLAQAVELVSAAGRVVVVGMSSATAPVRPGAFPEKEIDVVGSSCATAADFRDAIGLVAANRGSIANVFSHHFPLARAAEAFEFAMSRPPDAIKIVVTVN